MNTIETLKSAIEKEEFHLSGYNKPSEFLTIETLRAIDFSFCRELYTTLRKLSPSEQIAEQIRRHSINNSLKRVLPKELKATHPEISSSELFSKRADEFLLRTGSLTLAEIQLNKLYSGELKGNTHTDQNGNPNLLILLSNQENPQYEQIGFTGLEWLSYKTTIESHFEELALEKRHIEILPSLNKYLRKKNILKKPPPFDIDNYFKEWARLYLKRIPFRDMLDDNDVFGGRSYSMYIAVLEALSTMSQQRLCYANIWKSQNSKVRIRNIITSGSIHSELTETIADFLGGTESEIKNILTYLTLTPQNADIHLHKGIPALAPAVKTSHFLTMLPMYGLETNPFLFLWTELRTRHEREWFDAANRREIRWISELEKKFSTERWSCMSNIKIKNNGKTLTDIDFVIHDNIEDSVILFQLKWQQPFLTDEKIRRNNAEKLIKNSNAWIKNIYNWMNEIGNAKFRERLSIKSTKHITAYIVVMGRYHAHFTSSEIQDPRAIWCDWGNFLRIYSLHPGMSAHQLISELKEFNDDAVSKIAPQKFFFSLDKLGVLVNPTRIIP